MTTSPFGEGRLRVGELTNCKTHVCFFLSFRMFKNFLWATCRTYVSTIHIMRFRQKCSGPLVLSSSRLEGRRPSDFNGLMRRDPGWLSRCLQHGVQLPKCATVTLRNQVMDLLGKPMLSVSPTQKREKPTPPFTSVTAWPHIIH